MTVPLCKIYFIRNRDTLVKPVRGSYNNGYMAKPHQNEQELQYEPVQEDLEIIALVLQFLALDGNIFHPENPDIAHDSVFQIAKSAERPASPELDR